MSISGEICAVSQLRGCHGQVCELPSICIGLAFSIVFGSIKRRVHPCGIQREACDEGA